MLPVFSVKIYNKNNKERPMHSSNHTLLPELEPTVITEVGALITTLCYLTYTHSYNRSRPSHLVTTPYSNNRGSHLDNHTLLLDIHLK